MADSIAVIIPFYQRESGILLKAIASALAQVQVVPPTIIVVDDASPVPAKVELKDVMLAHPGRTLPGSSRCRRPSRSGTLGSVRAPAANLRTALPRANQCSCRTLSARPPARTLCGLAPR
ncbi:MAG TPA: hypothetical protein VFG03_19960 [Telluria sp.]|nr:hypothetical protein [Telluria sp.]